MQQDAEGPRGRRTGGLARAGFEAPRPAAEDGPAADARTGAEPELAAPGTPFLGDEALWSRAGLFATLGIFLIVFIAALDLGRPVLMPVVSAFVIGTMLGPLSRRAAAMGVPTVVAAIALWFLVVALFYGIIMLISAPLVGWIAKAPDIGRSLMEKVRILERPFAALRDLHNAVLPGGNGGGGGIQLDLMALLQPAVGLVTPALTQLLIFFATLFFYLMGHTRVRHSLVGAFERREARLTALRILNDTERNLTRYLSVVAVINLGVGVCGGIIAYAVGLPSPPAWAGLAFILNFIPYIGALIMELSLFAVGLVTFETVTHALIAPLLYLGVAIVEGQFVTPSIIGQRLLLSPMMVFLALVFWTWLWGPFGAFLAVPLLIIIMVAANHLFPKDEPALPG